MRLCGQTEKPKILTKKSTSKAADKSVRPTRADLLLLVVHNHLVEGLAVFVSSIHGEGGCLTVLRQN